MKKILLITLVCAAVMMVSAPASAFDLNWGGEVMFHFVDRDMGTLYYDADDSAGYDWQAYNNAGWTGLGDGVEDSWGIASISTITKPDHGTSDPLDVLWNSLGSGEYLEAHFYGLDDVAISGTSSGSVDTLTIDSGAVSGGAYVDIYLDNSYGFNIGPYATPGNAGYLTGAAHNVGAITDGTLLFRLQFVPTYANGAVYSNTYAFNNQPGQNYGFVYGSGSGYLTVDPTIGLGGLLDHDYYDGVYDGADAYFTAHFDVNTDPADWTVATTGTATTATPEPASMALFGLGLIGAALRKRFVA